MTPKIYKTVSPAIFTGLTALIINCDSSKLKDIGKEQRNQEEQDTINTVDFNNGIPSEGWEYFGSSVIEYLKEREIKYKRA